MTNETAIGAQGDNLPIKTFNEMYEKSVGRMVMKFIRKEKRTDGGVAYVVSDMSALVVGIMEFYGEKFDKTRGRI